jgi:hypothetical protein
MVRGGTKLWKGYIVLGAVTVDQGYLQYLPRLYVKSRIHRAVDGAAHTHKGETTFGDFSPESKGYIGSISYRSPISSLLSTAAGLVDAPFLSIGTGRIICCLGCGWRSGGRGARSRQTIVTFAGARSERQHQQYNKGKNNPKTGTAMLSVNHAYSFWIELRYQDIKEA